MKTQIIKKINNKKFDESVCCIGYFDGVHKGHQALIDRTILEAKKLNVKSGVICFDPDPFDLITGKKQKHITSIDTRLAFFENLGVDIVYIIKFDKDLLKLSPNKFISDYLNKMNLIKLICGKDFSFGKGGKGTPDLLKQKCNFKTIVVKQLNYQGNKISSTAIKQALYQGDISLASELLGYPYLLLIRAKNCSKQGKEYLIEGKCLDTNVLLPAERIYTKNLYIKNNKVYIIEKHSVKVGEVLGICFNE